MPWLQAANAFAQWQQQALQQMTSMWSGAMPFGAAMPGAAAPADRRFAADAWRNDPRFDGLTRAYLGQSELLQKTLAAAPLDDRSKAQWGFVLRQVVDALSPANCPGHQPRGDADGAGDAAVPAWSRACACSCRTSPRAASR